MKKPKNTNEAPKLERVSISNLVQNSLNPRKITEKKRKQLLKSIEEFGNLSPITWNKTTGRVIGGNQRLESYREAGHAEVDVWVVELDESKEKAAMVALNTHAGEWDDKRLAEIIKDLQDATFDLDLTGFDSGDLDKLLASLTEQTDTDADVDLCQKNLDALVEKWGVKDGQVWELGLHRLACGDSTLETVVSSVLRGDVPHLMVTDPPYGVELDAGWRSEVNGDGPDSKRATGKVLNDDNADWSETWALFPGDVAYVWHADRFASVVSKSLEANGFCIRNQVIWAKSQIVFGRGDYHFQHEPCWYAVRKGKSGHFLGDRKQTTLWQIDKPKNSETGHSTQKPIECMARPIRNNSKPGDLVYEPFSGSGTTLIACEQLGRKCRAIELNPQYVAATIERWNKATGKDPSRL